MHALWQPTGLRGRQRRPAHLVSCARSVAFDCRVDAPHKDEGREVADRPKHDESCVARHQHVAEEEGGLHETEHARTLEICGGEERAGGKRR